MLVVTGSVYTCIEALSSLQKRGQVFPHPTLLLHALQEAMAVLYPPSSDPTLRPPSPHTSNRAARDTLFSYLSSPHCHLFSHSVKLNNLTLDHLLFQGRGLPCTIATCYHLDELGLQFETAPALTTAVATAAGRREVEQAELLSVLRHPQHHRALFQHPVPIDEADAAKLWVGVQAGEDSLAYLLLIEEDVLMRKAPKLSGVDELRHEVQRRHAAMRVERRREMERLYEFLHQPMRRVMRAGTVVSMEECGKLVMAGREDLRPERPCQTIRIIADMEAQREGCTGVEDLIAKVKERRKGMTVPLGERPPVIPTPTAAGRAAKAGPPPEPQPVVVTVTAAMRDALFDYLAGEECSLFSSNVKLNNRALDGLITAGGSLQATLDIAHALHARGEQFESVDALKAALAQHVKAAAAVAAAPIVPPTPIERSAAAPPAARAPTGASPAMSASPAPSAPPPVLKPAPVPIEVTAADRDAVFDVLAEETELFVVDVKLTNKALDSIITAGGGRVLTIAALHQLHSRRQQFPSIAALTSALQAQPAKATDPRDVERNALFDWLVGPECWAFSKVAKVGTTELDALLSAGKGVAGTTELIRRVQAFPLQFTSADQMVRVLSILCSLPTSPPPVPSQSFPASDRDALFDALASDECNVFTSNVKLNNRTLDKLLCAGRGLHSTLSILRHINTRAQQVPGVSDLAAVLDADVGVGYHSLFDLSLFFVSPASPLPSTPAVDALLRLYWDVEVGTDCIHHLKALSPTPVYDLSALLPLLVVSRDADGVQVQAEVEELYEQMGADGGAQAEAGGGVRGKGKGLRAVLEGVEGLSVFECWRLVKAGRVGLGVSAVSRYIGEWVDSGRSFDRVEGLIEAVERRRKEEELSQKGKRARALPLRL